MTVRLASVARPIGCRALIQRLRAGDPVPLKDQGHSRERTDHHAAATEAAHGRVLDASAPDADARLLKMFNASPVGLILTRADDGTVLEINDHYCRLLGYTRAQVLGKRTTEDVHSWLHPADRGALLSAIERDGVVHGVETRFRSRDGESRMVVVSFEPIRFNDTACFVGSAFDITQAKQTEAALKRSESTHRALFANIPSAAAHCRVIFRDEVAVDCEILQVNPAFGALTGWNAVEGTRVSQLYPDYAECFPEMLAILGRVASSGEATRHEQFVAVSGQWFSHTIYSPAPNEVVVIADDITQRKLVEQELVASKTKFEAALNSMSDAVFISDEQGRFLDFNDAFATFHRFRTRDECARTLAEYPHFLEVSYADGAVAAVDQWAVPRALRGELGSNVEYRLRRLDSGDTWIGSYSFAPIRDAAGVIIGSIVTARDVTEQKRVENEVHKLASLIEQSTESVIVTDTLGRLEYVNDAFVRKSGYSKAELIGKDAKTLIAPSTSRASLIGLERSMRLGERWRGDLRKRRRDGSEYIVQAVISPIRRSDGQIGNYAAITEDVTERRRNDIELRQHRHHLQMLVDQRTRELAVALDAAEAATRAKSLFLANMSHEVRTPLNAVLGVAQMGLRDAGDDRTRESFRRILESGRLLLTVLNDILDLSKIEAMKLDFEIVPVVPSRVLDELVRTWQPAAQEKGLTLSCEVCPGLPAALLSDPVRLVQILSNLLSNAIKFTSTGTITVRAVAAGDSAEFSVADTGIGIRASDLDRLFSPFEQADATTTRRFGGTGLGLTISRRLAALLGGTLSVTSEYGVGSTFTLRVPLQATAAPEATGSEVGHAGAQALEGLHLLVAEDNALSRAVIEDALLGFGARVTLARDGLEAVAAVAREGPSRFALVLMDVQMPELDGFEATREIHALAPDLRVVGQTAHAHREEHELCYAAGMVDVVTKPLDFDVLAEVVLRHARVAPT